MATHQSTEIKEALMIEVSDNESARHWLSVVNGLKNRDVKDVLIICADGLTGIGETDFDGQQSNGWRFRCCCS